MSDLKKVSEEQLEKMLTEHGVAKEKAHALGHKQKISLLKRFMQGKHQDEPEAGEPQQDSEDEEDEEQEPEPPKKHKKNLRRGETAQERSYASRERMREIAMRSVMELEKKNLITTNRDKEISRRKELKEELKREKREARLQRKQERLDKLKKKSESTAAKRKKKLNHEQ